VSRQRAIAGATASEDIALDEWANPSQDKAQLVAAER